MTNYDIVKKLIGDVRPKGDSSRDYDVAYDFKDDKQGTIVMCQQEASKYLDSLGIFNG